MSFACGEIIYGCPEGLHVAKPASQYFVNKYNVKLLAPAYAAPSLDVFIYISPQAEGLLGIRRYRGLW